MKYILLIAVISLSFTSCTKDFSQEGQQSTETFIIDNENGGLNFFLHSTGAEMSAHIYRGTIAVPVNESNQYYEYEVSADDLQDNVEYTVELQYHTVSTSGTFDLMVEGFTAISGTKSFWLRDIPISVTEAGTKKKILKMNRTGNRYTFTWY